MMRSSKILWATSLGPGDRGVRDYAVELAKRRQASLLAVHVEPALYAPIAAIGIPYWMTRSNSPILLARLKRRLEDVAGIPHQCFVLCGEPGEQIVRFARDEQASLIVMGTHGRSGIRRLFEGSVAELVVRTAPCPVCTVRNRVIPHAWN